MQPFPQSNLDPDRGPRSRLRLAVVAALTVCAAGIGLLVSPVFGAGAGPLTVDGSGHWFEYADSGDPYFMAGSGGPEGYLYYSDSRKQSIVDQLIANDVRAIYIHAVRSDGGDGGSDQNPFRDKSNPGSGVDPAVLGNWDRYLSQLDDAGIVTWFHLYDDGARPYGACNPDLPQGEKDFVKALVERFRDYQHLVWLPTEEHIIKACGNNSVDVEKAKSLAAEIRKYDAVHPVGVHHNNGQSNQYLGNTDIDVFSQQICQNGEDSVDGLHEAGEWGEDVYVMAECHPWHKDLLDDGDRTTLRQGFWASVMAGGYVLFYDAWESTDPSQDMLADLGRINAFMDTTRFAETEPADQLAAGGTRWVLANESNDLYILYSNTGPSDLGVQGITAGSYQLSWFNPVDGNRVAQTVDVGGGIATFPVPGGMGAEVALYLQPADAPPPPSNPEPTTPVPTNPEPTTPEPTNPEPDGPETRRAPMEDAYLQNSKAYNTTHLRVESGSRHRVTYLRFDTSDVAATGSVRLELTVSDDPGTGTVTVSKGVGGAWTDSDLSVANAPKAAEVLASVQSSFKTGNKVLFDLPADVVSGEVLDLVIEIDAGGVSDVAFDSTAADNPPALLIGGSGPTGPTVTSSPDPTVAPDPTPTPTGPAPTSPAIPGLGVNCGVVTLEAESLAVNGAWRTAQAPQASGGRYIVWEGLSESANNNSPADVITHKVRIDRPGSYRFSWAMRQPDNVESDKANDSWLNFPDASRFGPTGGGDYPEFVKVYGNSKGSFAYSATADVNHSKSTMAIEYDRPGIYTMQIAGRSHGHQIDRIVLHHESISRADALAGPANGCTDGTAPVDPVVVDPVVVPVVVDPVVVDPGPGGGDGTGPGEGRQNVTYRPTTDVVPNPERGFHRGAGNMGSAYKDGYRLVRDYVRLDDYRDRPLDQRVFGEVDDLAAEARKAGVKIVLRFSYNFGKAPDASMSRIDQHLGQLEPVLRRNSDVIAVLQAGFVGAWGEWHSSTNGIDDAGQKAKVRAALLDVLPDDRMIQLRYPDDLMDMERAALSSQRAFTAADQARTGHKNDCFLANEHDAGTYTPMSRKAEFQTYLAALTEYTVMGGETCQVSYPNQRTGCATALAELDRFNWDYLNLDFYGNTIDKWRSDGCFGEIERRLGYRYRMLSATANTSVASGGRLGIELDIANEGFGKLYNPRPLNVVLLNESTGRRYRMTAAADARKVLPTGGSKATVDLSVVVPGSVPSGTYSVHVELPDGSARLADDARYSVRFANASTWRASLGVNDLSLDVTVGR